MKHIFNKIILHLDNYCCRLVSLLLSYLGKHPQFFLDEMSICRYIKREYDYINIPDRSDSVKQGDTIWTFWAQGEKGMPPVIRCCYESIMANRGEYRVVLLEQDNIADYIDIPSRILDLRSRGKMSWTHFSDYLRMAILEKYGGWYIDSTIYVSRTIPTLTQLFTIRLKERDNSVANGDWCGFLWYMPQGHPLSKYVLMCLNDYWAKNDTIIAYLLIDYIIRIYFSKKTCNKEELGSIPYTCEDLLFFQRAESEQCFDAQKWDVLVSRNLFFKNAWRKQLHMYTEDGKRTYYGHVFNMKVQ